jgi:hypothetical protein
MSDSPIIGVHQPNFFPWLGYFHKIRWSDTFVLLDDAQIQKTGGSVTNRCELVSNGKQVFFTAAIDRSKSGGQMIREVEFAAREDVRAKLTSFLKQAYSKAPFMKELGEEILAIVNGPAATLGEYNANAIRKLSAMLDLTARFETSSALDIHTASTERLVDIVSRLGGKTYLAGAGAKDYQDDSMFFAKSIQVWYRDFVPPAYPRPNKNEEPKAGLSVLDALLLLGKKGTRDLLDQQPLDREKLRTSTT